MNYSRPFLASWLLATAFSGAVSAADLDGSCCADLDERIAELQASIPQNGTRKVSLAISGWVSQQLMFWDDGYESNVYVHDLGSTLGSHVKFTGKAQIASDWYAGYVLHVEAINSDSWTIDQDTPRGPITYEINGVQTLQSYWYVKSAHFGQLSVGLQSPASDNAAMLVDGSGSLVPANWLASDVSGFYTRLTSRNALRITRTLDPDETNKTYSQQELNGEGGQTWGMFGQCFGGAWGDCNGFPSNVVRYDTSNIAGFSMSASWGEDGMWDVAGRYAGVIADFKFGAALAYSETPIDTGQDFSFLQAGAYVEHIPTGLFAYGAYGRSDPASDRVSISFAPLSIDIDEATQSETFYFKAGLRTKIMPMGATIFYGEYEALQGDTDRTVSYQISSNKLEMSVSGDEQARAIGAGIVQEIDSADMSVWLKYRHFSGEYSNFPELGVTYNELSSSIVSAYLVLNQNKSHDFHYIGLGTLIAF